MGIEACRTLRLPRYRRFVVDYSNLCRHMPLITLERHMNLKALVDARGNSLLRPSWTAIFIKAYARMALLRPEMRRAFMRYLVPHLYEHYQSRATFIVERLIEGEEVPLYSSIDGPEHLPLVELHKIVQEARSRPLEEMLEFRILRWLLRAPGPIRWFLWRLAYHWSGWGRAQWFGTFGITSVASLGAGLNRIVTGIPTLHYSTFDDDGGIFMRLTVDHRLLDGAPVARALAQMEEILLTEILYEIRGGASATVPCNDVNQRAAVAGS
jgi:hypothetical protein